MRLFAKLPVMVRNALPEPGFPSVEVRRAAIQALAMLGIKNTRSYPMLVAAAQDTGPLVRQGAAEILMEIPDREPGECVALSAGLLKPELGTSRAIELIQQYNLRGAVGFQ